MFDLDVLTEWDEQLSELEQSDDAQSNEDDALEDDQR